MGSRCSSRSPRRRSCRRARSRCRRLAETPHRERCAGGGGRRRQIDGVTVLLLFAVKPLSRRGNGDTQWSTGHADRALQRRGLDAKLMTETIDPLATYAVDPSGAIAMACGALLTGWSSPHVRSC